MAEIEAPKIMEPDIVEQETSLAALTDIVGEDLVQYIFATAPRKVRTRVEKALHHLTMAPKLVGLDEEMGTIRLIAAEEELVVAIFEWLKLNADTYPEHEHFARRHKNHQVKLAFYPVLAQFRFALGGMLEDGLAIEGIEDLHFDIRPVVDADGVKLQLLLPGGREVVRHNPLAISVSLDDASDEEVRESLFKRFVQLVQDQQGVTLREFLTTRADYRNKLLYAEDRGGWVMKESLGELLDIQRTNYRDLLWTLAILLGNKPVSENYGLVSQFIWLYRRALAELR